MMKYVAAVCTVLLAAILLMSLFAPQLAPYDPNAVDMRNRLAAPSAEHLLGTDTLGRDLLSRTSTADGNPSCWLWRPPSAPCWWGCWWV